MTFEIDIDNKLSILDKWQETMKVTPDHFKIDCECKWQIDIGDHQWQTSDMGDLPSWLTTEEIIDNWYNWQLAINIIDTWQYKLILVTSYMDDLQGEELFRNNWQLTSTDTIDNLHG